MTETKPSTSGSAPVSGLPEPSMEEIIASINRIIAEDNRSSAAPLPDVSLQPGRAEPGATPTDQTPWGDLVRRCPPEPARRVFGEYPQPQRGILELTEAIAADGTIRKLDRAGAASLQSDHEPAPAPLPFRPLPAPDPAPGPVLDRLDPEAPGNTGEGGVSTAPSDPEAGNRPTPQNALLSAVTSDAAIAAFARLGNIAAELRRQPGPSLAAASRTLEEIVHDALRPLLRAWLDAHLPGIVERLVQEEIRSLVGEVRPR
jgi:uncharacterized protein